MTVRAFTTLKTFLRHIRGRQAHFPHEMSFLLELPLRRLLLSPAQLADRLALGPDARVLDLGAGSGFYAAGVARHLTTGSITLLDVQAGMLARAHRNLGRAGLGARARYLAARADRTALADSSFDAVFMVSVLGEVPEAGPCLVELRRLLRAEGLLSISEHLPDPDFTRLRALRARVEPVGFVFEARFGPPWSYTASFRRA